jgi:flagellar protein FliS
MRKNLKAYKQVDTESAILASDPHTIITMLFNGIFESISVAKGAILRNELELKSTQLSKAMSIIRSLQDCLDHDSQPDISDNFYQLYSYCIDRLLDASVSLNVELLDEVVTLLQPISEAWQGMPNVDKEEGHSLLKSKALAS